jgi:hypothetical protein
MKDKNRRGKRDQLDEHSLPGTNQDGTGPGSCEKNGREHTPGGMPPPPDQLDEHSLPGTNQAGKGPGSREKDGQEHVTRWRRSAGHRPASPSS